MADLSEPYWLLAMPAAGSTHLLLRPSPGYRRSHKGYVSEPAFLLSNMSLYVYTVCIFYISIVEVVQCISGKIKELEETNAGLKVKEDEFVKRIGHLENQTIELKKVHVIQL